MSARRDPDRSALAVFADELRAQRELAGLGREELAGRLNYSASLISMIESGHRSPSRDFAGRCDEAFGTPGTFARLEKRLRDVPFSSGFRPFQPYENQAVSLRLFEHTMIPGLLQTEGYARAVLETHPNTSAEVIEERVAARLARQVILDRDDPPPPMLWVLLDENVLTREVGGAKVMHDQLARLAEAARRPNVTVQVIPGVGAHTGLLGAFAIAEVTGLPAIVYLETAHEGQTLEDPDVGARMSLRFDALRTEALTGASLPEPDRESDRGTMDNPDDLTWRTSSYSGSNGGNCIEVAAATGVIAVRDSKDQGGPVLMLGPRDWQRFADHVKGSAC